MIAYLIRKYKWKVTEALEKIQKISPRIDPNAGFLMQLAQIEGDLMEDVE